MTRIARTLLLVMAALPAAAQDDAFVPEELTVEERIAPGPNVFVMDQSWTGPSRINVLSADDLSVKGNLDLGTTGQMVLGLDGRTLYGGSVYMKRFTYGPMEAVIQEFDVETLSRRREIPVSERMAMVETQPGLMALTADGAYLLVQNATPATSVSVVDLAAGAQIAEIPTPGCWTVEPAREGRRFTTVCGDGTLETHSFEPDGSFSDPAMSEAIFDPDADALFPNPARAGDELIFASFGGNLYRVSDAGEVPELLATLPLTEGVEGGWAPGGSEVIAHNAAHGVAFVLMHSEASEGSHKDHGEEIWAVDMASGEVLYRSTAGDENSIAVTQDAAPVIYATDDHMSALHRYEVDPEARFAAKRTATAEGLGDFITLVLTER